MKYTPKVSILLSEKYTQQKKQELVDRIDKTEKELYNLPMNPISDTTSFIVKSTTIDTDKLADKRFKERNESYILAIDLFSALSNLEPEDQQQSQLTWIDLKNAKKKGFKRREEEKALEIIRLYNESRGRKGKFSMQLITTREELIARHKKEEEESKKKGFWGFSKKQQPQQSDVEDMGVDGEFTK